MTTPPTHQDGIAAAKAIAAEVGLDWADMRQIAVAHMEDTMPELEEIGSSDVSCHLASLGNHEAQWLRTTAEELKWGKDKVGEIMTRTGKTEQQVVADLRRLLAPVEE